MNTVANGNAADVRLPSTLAIGFTGHRTLGDETKCRQAILIWLEQQKKAASALVYGISSVAAGGDLLFAESCLQLGLPLRVLLPLEVEEFRKDLDEGGWARAEKILRQAAAVEVIGGSRSRVECYYECGIATVQQSRLLLALWDGTPAQGLGGTEDVVSFARGIGRPVVWLHSATGAMQTFNEQTERGHPGDAELEFLNQLPEVPESGEPDTPGALARAWFRKVDASATRLAPQFRRLAAIPIIFTAAAALLSGTGSWGSGLETWLTIATAFGILAAVLRLNQRRILWVRTRIAAEVGRSVLAFWHTPAPYEAIGPEVVPELAGVLASLDFLKLLDRTNHAGSLDEFKRHYRQERVAGQIEYFAHQGARSAAAARRYRITIWVCIVVAALLNLGMFLVPLIVGSGGREAWKPGLALGAAIAFQIATVAGALRVVQDCDRRRQRYRELHRQLGEWDAQLAALRTWPSVLGVAGRIERALLAELIEWRSLLRHPKVAKKTEP